MRGPAAIAVAIAVAIGLGGRAPAEVASAGSASADGAAVPDDDDRRAFAAALATLDDDPAAGVAALEAFAATRPTSPLAPEAGLAAARASEERLLDPAAARRRYAAVVAGWPDARAAVAAGRRLATLAIELGDDPAAAEFAAAFARLRRSAGARPTAAEEAEAARLAAAPWPGALDVGLWHVEQLRRADRLAEATALAAALRQRFAGAARVDELTRAAAQLALARRAWSEAAALADVLPAGSPGEQALRAELAAAVARGRQLDRWRRAAMLVAALGLLALTASLLHAAGDRRGLVAALRPPLELWYVAPVLGLLVVAAATGFPDLGHAVAWIAAAGLGVTYLSGAALDAARRRGRHDRRRVLVHAVAAPAVVLALAAVALLDAQLVDVLLETLRAGPARGG
ncbi:MAG: hypothetical protein R2939_01350 [Kofleriaceae bacterium]